VVRRGRHRASAYHAADACALAQPRARRTSGAVRIIRAEVGVAAAWRSAGATAVAAIVGGCAIETSGSSWNIRRARATATGFTGCARRTIIICLVASIAATGWMTAYTIWIISTGATIK